MSDVPGFEQHDLAPPFRRGERRRHSGEAATDDNKVSATVTLKRGLRRKPIRGGAVIVAGIVQPSHAQQQMLALP